MKTLRRATAFFIVLSLILVLFVGCAGKAGVGITGATVDSSGHLILSLSDGTTADAGYVVGPMGATGATGSAGPSGSSSSVAGQSISLSSLITNIAPSLVYIDVMGWRSEAVGTGVIISEQGYILTCYHVIAGASSINVTLNSGVTVPATFITGSQGRDYAVIKLNTVPANLQVATLGSSSASSVGDYVVSGGFALAYTVTPSFTCGIISAFRTLSDGYDYVQTDAAINSGDSGGPLINMAGQVIGINAQVEVYDDSGDPVSNMGYCLPIDDLTTAIQPYIGG